MRSYSLLVTVLVMLGLTSAVSFGQFKQGDWDLNLSGTGGNNRDFNAGSANVSAGLGYFLNDNVELFARQSVGYAKLSSDGGSNWTGSTRVGMDWNIGHAKLVPFVGFNIGYNYGDGVADTGEAAPEAGLKWFHNDTTYLFAMAEYQFFFRNSDQIDDAARDGQFVYTIGIGLRL